MAYSADSKPTELTALTSLANDDTVIVGDTSDTSEVVKTITKANLVADLADETQTLTNKTINTASNTITVVEADISDLGTYLENVSEDTTPQLGGELVAGDNNISGLGSVSFTQELDNGSKTASFTVDFANDQKQKATLTANTITLTLDTTDIGVGNYVLKLVNGGLATLTWAAETGSIKWPSGTAPTLTSSGTDIISFYFDGTDFYGIGSLNFS